MKAGYKVETNIDENAVFVIVSNYQACNKVCLYGFENLEDVENNTSETNDIGFWRIKRR